MIWTEKWKCSFMPHFKTKCTLIGFRLVETQNTSWTGERAPLSRSYTNTKASYLALSVRISESEIVWP